SDRMNCAIRSASAVATSSLPTSAGIVSLQTPDRAFAAGFRSGRARVVSTGSTGAGSSGAYCGDSGVEDAGNCVLKTSFAQSHNAPTDRKFVVNGTTRPTDGSVKRARTML